MQDEAYPFTESQEEETADFREIKEFIWRCAGDEVASDSLIERENSFTSAVSGQVTGVRQPA